MWRIAIGRTSQSKVQRDLPKFHMMDALPEIGYKSFLGSVLQKNRQRFIRISHNLREKWVVPMKRRNLVIIPCGGRSSKSRASRSNFSSVMRYNDVTQAISREDATSTMQE